MKKYSWYFKFLLLCLFYLSAQGQIAWNELPISDDAQNRIKTNWDNAIDAVKEGDRTTGQNMAENIEKMAENAGISFSESPSPSPTMTPTPSVTPSKSPSPSVTPTSSPSETPPSSTTPTATPTPTKSASPTPFWNRRSASPSPSPAVVEVKQTTQEIDVPTDGTESSFEFEPVLSDEEEENLYEPVAVGQKSVISDFKIDGDFSGEIAPTGRQIFRERVLGKAVVRQSIGLPPQVRVFANGVAFVIRRTVSCTGSLLPVIVPQRVELELVQVYGDRAGVKIVFKAEGPFGNACRILFSFEVTTVRKLREGLLPSLSPISAPSRSPISIPTITASPEPSVTPSASSSLPAPSVGTAESPSPSYSGSSAPASPYASYSASATPASPYASYSASATPASPYASYSASATPASPYASYSASATPAYAYESSSASATPDYPDESSSASAAPASPSVSSSASGAPASPSASPSVIIVPDNQHGMTCASHPAYFDGLKGVLVRSWKTLTDRDRYTVSAYRPRYGGHAYAPTSNPDSKKYENLDLMVFHHIHAVPDPEILFLKFTRPAIVYIFYWAHHGGFQEMSFEDWDSEGWATLKSGSLDKINLSLEGEVYFQPRQYAYVFSKRTVNNEIILPGGGYIAENASGPRSVHTYWLLFAEEDGSASVEPLQPVGVNGIIPGQRCPASLHDLWVAPARPEEPDVAGEKFETVHPLWDPCYWCAYTHEHGSIPFDAMNWYPRLDYVSFKNNENESREGHKGYMIRSGDYLFYYGLHAHVSQSRRFFTRFHTVIFVVVDAKSKEKLLELSHKGDFGFLAGQKPPHGFGSLPVNVDDYAIFDEISKSSIPAQRRVIRLVNVNNPENRDPTFGYRNLPNLLSFFYEEWKTFPMCSDGNGFLEVDITNPSTALRFKGGGSEMTKLGTPQDDNPYEVKFQNPSTKRLIRAFGFKFGSQYCNFAMPDSTGVFYTSPDGLTLKSGPGPNNVRQFIKPGFTFSLRGIYRPNDTFVGMHFENDDAMNVIYDIGRVLDPNLN